MARIEGALLVVSTGAAAFACRSIIKFDNEGMLTKWKQAVHDQKRVADRS